MTSQNFNLIYKAIQNNLQVHADFDGHHRELCPHVLGYKKGSEQALFCQFGGSSKSQGLIAPQDAQWRCISVGQLTNLRVIEGPWYTLDTKKKKRTSCVDDVVIEIPFE